MDGELKTHTSIRPTILCPRERPVALFTAIYMAVFSVVAMSRANYEFALYAGVIIVLYTLLLINQRRLRFDGTILWGLSLWGLLHMAGGNIRIGEGVLYSVQLIPSMLRFDEFVHFCGFGVATLACHHLLCTHLRPGAGRGAMFKTLVVLMGCGVGAVNEVLEYVAVLVVPETGVGGYQNTLWDMVFNLFGAVAAVTYLSVSGSLGFSGEAERGDSLCE